MGVTPVGLARYDRGLFIGLEHGGSRMRAEIPPRMLLRGIGRYLAAACLVAAAVLFRWALPSVLAGTPYLAFYPAVVVAAGLCGFGPGLLATLAAGLCVDFVFTPPPAGFSHLANPVELSRLAIFVAGGTGVSALAWMLRRSERRYRVVATHTHDWEFWLAPDGRFYYNSPSCLTLTGYDAAAFDADPHLLCRIIHPGRPAALPEAPGQRRRAMRHRGSGIPHHPPGWRPPVDQPHMLAGL